MNTTVLPRLRKYSLKKVTLIYAASCEFKMMNANNEVLLQRISISLKGKVKIKVCPEISVNQLAYKTQRLRR